MPSLIYPLLSPLEVTADLNILDFCSLAFLFISAYVCICIYAHTYTQFVEIILGIFCCDFLGSMLFS